MGGLQRAACEGKESHSAEGGACTLDLAQAPADVQHEGELAEPDSAQVATCSAQHPAVARATSAMDELQLRWRAFRGRVVTQPSLAASMATEWGELLQSRRGDVHGVAVSTGVWQQFMRHDRIAEFFGRGSGYPHLAQLLTFAQHGVPVDVTGETCLQKDFERGNHHMSDAHRAAFQAKVIEDLQLGRVLLIPYSVAHDLLRHRLRLCPVFAKDESAGKIRIVHDWSASNPLGGLSVNDSTDTSCLPPVQCANVLPNLLQYIWSNALAHPTKHIVLAKLDVKSAYRHMLVSLHGTLMGYRFHDAHVVIDARLQFGWAASPAAWEVAGESLAWSVGQDGPGAGPLPSPGACEVAKSVATRLPNRGPVRVQLPSDERAKVRGNANNAASPPFSNIFVDDLCLAMVVHDAATARATLQAVTASAVHAHYQLLGHPHEGGPPALSTSKVTDWSTELIILGWLIDTQNMTLGITQQRRERLRAELDQWPVSRTSAHWGALYHLAGTLQWLTLGVPAARYFCARVWRALKGQRGRYVRTRSVAVPHDVHDDLRFWRWVVDRGPTATPIAAIVTRDADARWYSDASYEAIGGVCPERGIWWRFDLTAAHKQRLVKGTRAVTGSLHINLLELAGMVLTAYVLACVLPEPLPAAGAVALLRGDNMSAVSWIRRGGSADDSRCRGLLRLLGIIELHSGWSFAARHIQGARNEAADGITRLAPHEIEAKLRQLYPRQQQWRQHRLTEPSLRIISAALGGSWPQPAWESALWSNTAALLSSSCASATALACPTA